MGLIYHARFAAAQLHFARLALERPADPVGPALEASTLIWWGEARDDEAFEADTIDRLLTDAVARAERALATASGDSARVTALFWLGTSLGYRARQAELSGRWWRAARDAKGMRAALGRAVAMDSACVDCLLGLAVYDYGLARASVLVRVAARILGLGGGDAGRALAWLRRASEHGVLTRTEARWIYANALLRESAEDGAGREESRRLVGELAAEFGENPVFRRFLDPASAVR